MSAAATASGPAPIAALARRLRSAAEAALPVVPEPGDDLERDADSCFHALVTELVATRDPALAWLLLTTMAGAFPLAEDVRAVLRAVDLNDETDLALLVMDRARALSSARVSAGRPMRICRGAIVDVDACARSTFHNGIQRTAREVARRWAARDGIAFGAWSSGGDVWRSLVDVEQVLATQWDESLQSLTAPDPTDADAAAEILVPWHADVILLEVPFPDRCPRLAALAEFSGSRVLAVGYDAIPVVSADLRPHGEANGTTSYLTAVKHATRVAGISTSAAEEFAGFRDALVSQGLAGPDVIEVPLPVTVPPPPSGWRRDRLERPLVVAVGRLEPHKNHDALLFAAERLWREGVAFDLRLVGGPGWDISHVQQTIERLRAAGAPLTWDTGVGDDELWLLLRQASCTVFISLHEGYGLPVAESLACGTPVLTTRYGSQAEIAAGGGCLTVDPRDDESVYEGLRTLVTDRTVRERLRAEAAARPVRTWDSYADELWEALRKESR